MATLSSNRPERIALVESAPTEMQAGVIVAALEQEGIKATMTGMHTSGFRAEAPGWVKILVAEEDLPRAKAVMQEVLRGQTDIDWSQVDVGEPEEADISDAVPWWLQLSFWRRVAIVLISIYLIWFAASFFVGLVGGLLRSMGVLP